MIKQDVDGAFPTGELRRRKVRHSAETQVDVNGESSPAPMRALALPSSHIAVAMDISSFSTIMATNNGHSESPKQGQLPLSRGAVGASRLATCLSAEARLCMLTAV